MRSLMKFRSTAFACIAGIIISSGYAFADNGEAVGDMSVFQMVRDHSGWPGLIIILLSVTAFFLALRFGFLLRSSVMMPEKLVEDLENDIDSLRVGSALSKCLSHGSALARIVENGLQEMRAGYDEMITAAEDSAEAESIRLHQQIGWLSLIGAIAPMLGLMGTVLGMLNAFGVIAAAATQPPPAALAEEIQFALVTTALGLIVGVPVLVVYAALRNRATAMFLDIGLVASDLLDRFKHTEITPAMIEEVSAALSAEVQDARKEPKTEVPDNGAEDEEPPPPPQAG